MRDDRRMDRLRVVLGISIGMAGCGGGDKGTGPNPPAPPPPPPAAVVTTIEISPGAIALGVADTTRLAATVKDQNGATMSGKTVAWTSGTAGVATVSADGLVTAVATGQATIRAAVDGKEGSAVVTVTPRVVVETSKAVSATIGSLGGSLTTTAGGATYTLEIPAASLSAKTVITMTPVTAHGRLPVDGEFVTGVKFEPDGLVLPKAATLRAVKPVTLAAGKMLVGYLANDTGAVVALATSTRNGDTLTLRVPHFTIAGWGQFTPPQVALLPPQLPSGTGETRFINQIVALPIPSSLATVRSIMEEWYTTFVEPELNRVTANTTAENLQAANDFRSWERSLTGIDGLFNLNGTLLAAIQPMRQTGIGLLRPVLTFGIASLVAECPTAPLTGPLEIAEQVFGLQDMAQAYGLATVANGLDTPSILSLLPQCVRVINTQADYPANPSPNVAATLALRYGVQLGGNPFATDLALKLTLTLAGSTTDGTQVTQTDIHGFISGQVTPTGQEDLVADLAACIHPSLGYRLDELCVRHQVVRSFGVTINGDVTVLTQTGLATLANVSKITGNLSVFSSSADPTTTTDLRELAMLTEVGGVVNVAGLPNLTSVSGLSRLRKAGALAMGLNRLLTDLSGLSSLTSVARINLFGLDVLPSLHGLEGIQSVDLLRLERLPALTSLGGLVGLQTVKSLWLIELPLIQSLQAFRTVAVTNEITVIRMNGLTTLRDLTALSPTLTGNLVIEENSGLADLASMVNVRSVGLLSIKANPLLPDIHELASITTAVHTVISGALLRNLAGLANLRQSGVGIDLDGSPLLDDIRLPALIGTGSVNGQVRVEGFVQSCRAGRVISVALPAFTGSGGDVVAAVAGNGPGCSIDVSMPALASGRNVFFGGGVTSLDLGGSLTALELVIANSRLSRLTVPSLAVEKLVITRNGSLASVSGGGGRVTTLLEISSNPQLSTLAALTWANSFNHGGAQVTVTKNKP